MSAIPNSSLANSSITLSNGNNITVTGSPVSLGGVASFNLTGTTNHSVQVGNVSGSLTSLIVGTNGQVLLGSTAANPVFGTLTSSDSSITFTTGPGTLSLQVAGGTSVGKTITGQSGGALSPTAGNWNIFGAVTAAGTSPVVTSGAASTLTVNVQTSQALAAADATKIGLSNFDSSSFAVAATGFVTLSTTGVLKTLTGNSGGAISPTANNINTLGTGSITIAGSGSTLTTQLTGLTNHAVQVGAGTATLTQLAVGTNGQVLIGATTADPAFATLTSSDGSISFTTGANSLSLQVASGTTAVKTLTGNSGGAISPTAGNINTLGTGSITIAGSGSTLTTQLTGLTNHAVLVGAGTATITNVGPTSTVGQVLQSAGAAADPAFSTATYPLTTTVSQILYSSATNVVSGLATANSATLVTTSAGVPVFSSTMTNGQMIIGSTGATPVAGTITSTGGTVTVTTGAGTLNLEVATGGFVWTDVSGAFSPLKENGYFITGTATGTLPASPAQGDTIKFFVDHATQVLTIQATAGKIIRFGSTVSAAAGTAVSTLQGDSCELTYRTADTCWCAISGFSGIWNVT